MLRGIIMEHNPMVSLNDGLEITYSDLKKSPDGDVYITIYFERPNDKKSMFDTAQMNYPGSLFTNVSGFTEKDLGDLMHHVKRAGKLAFKYAQEDALCPS